MPRARAPFVVDRAAVETARALLGLRRAVSVHITYYDGVGTQGRYVAFRDGVHRLALSGEQSAAEASSTLWHELGHAVQVERIGSFEDFDRRVRAEMLVAGLRPSETVRWWHERRYRRTPLEREAEAVVKRHAHARPLCVPRAK